MLADGRAGRSVPGSAVSTRQGDPVEMPRWGGPPADTTSGTDGVAPMLFFIFCTI